MEAVVSRMKTVQMSIKRESSNSNKMQAMRILAVSATIPNVEDVSKYIEISVVTNGLRLVCIW